MYINRFWVKQRLYWFYQAALCMYESIFQCKKIILPLPNLYSKWSQEANVRIDVYFIFFFNVCEHFFC